MLLSRFWYFVLAVGSAIAFAAALMTQAAFNRQYDSDLNDQLRRDRFELEMMLKTDARTRIDAIAPIAAHGDVRSALRRASGRNDRDRVPTDIRDSLADKLRSLNRQLEGMQAGLLFAVDDAGYIVAQLGAGDAPAGAGLGAFPLVERALAGYVRDDVWIYNGKVYRMAARPVIDSGQYVGAIVHGMELDDELARRLSERLTGATVTFFYGENIVGSHMPTVPNAARSEDVLAQLSQALEHEQLRTGGRTDPVDLGGGSRGVYSLATGSAAHAGVGYAVARPRHALAEAWDVFDLIAIDDVDALPLPLLIGGAAAFFLLGMFFLWVERDRPFGKLKRATASLGRREIDRLTVTDFGGGYRKVAASVNEAMDKAVESAAAASPKRKAADLDEILGPTREGAGPTPAQPFFGFANRGGGDEEIPQVPAAPPPQAGPGTGLEGAPKLPGGPPPAPAMAAGRGPSGYVPKPPPGPPPRPAAPPPAAPRPPLAAPPGRPMGAAAAVDDKPDWAKGTLLGVGAGEAAAGAGPVQRVVAKPAIVAPQEVDDEDEGATMIADVPRELLDAASGEAMGQQDADERHFREVFDRFVGAKKECGEPTTGLTFDKFVQTLRKNRDQIVSRHGAKTVRFTVYVKDGKAALKATPVKD